MSALSCPSPSACAASATDAPPRGAANILAIPHPISFGSHEVSAWLDHTDRIVHVSASWDTLADASHRRSEILARPLGWFIGDGNIRECFRALIERVRREHKQTSLVKRRDRAAMPCAVRLTFVPVSAGAVEITWSFFDGTPARRIPVAARHHFHGGELLRMCSWCHDVHLQGRWQRLENAASALGLLDHGSLPDITHGICPGCGAALSAETSSQRALQMAG